MRSFVLLIPLVIFFNFLALAQSEQEQYVTKSFDRFENKTTIQPTSLFHKKVNVRTQPRISAIITYSGKSRPEETPNPVILFSSISDDWKYSECHDTYCLADDKPVKLPEAHHNGEVLNGGSVIEVISLEVSYSTFVKLTNAKKLEFKICNTEFEVSEFEKICLKRVRELYEK